MNHRIESRPGMRSIVGALEVADGGTLARCRRDLTERAIDVLTRGEYPALDRILKPLMPGPVTTPELRRLAELADDRYLSALDVADGNADDKVLTEFAVARALASLVFLGGTDGANDVLDGAYELCVISPEEEGGVLRDMTAILFESKT